MDLQKNYNQIWAEIDQALKKAGRNKKDIHLIAVSKTRPVEDIQTIYNLGQLDFGENKPQEIRDKVNKLPSNIRWHMIGHLQSNKIKYVVGTCDLIHSVDTIKLAYAINDYASKTDVVSNILLQVDIAQDGKKQGFTEVELEKTLEEIANLSHLRVKGLMTIAPYVENPEENRKIFQRIKQISVDIQRKNYDNIDMNVLSMGMSNDYIVAIEEGATHVRIGTAIFGKRDYNK